MTLKYESELIKEIVDARGHEKSPLHYQSECVENWINEAKGGYPKLCDYESEWLNYINENPIGEFPYETFTGTEGTIENVVPYAYKTAILRGHTLVNIATKHDEGTNSGGEVIMKPTLLKANTKYYIKVIDDEFNLNKASFRTNDWEDIWYYPTNGVVILTTPSQDIFDNYMYLTFRLAKNGEIVKINNTIRDRLKWIICEYQEDMEKWNIPHFEGMQSVKMPVLTTIGKNLFDKTRATRGYIINASGGLSSSSGNGATDYIKVESGKTYVKNVGGFIAFYDSNKNFIERTSTSTTKFTVVNDGYIRCNIGSYDNVIDTLQIEEGSVATSYEPYKSNILTVNEEVELRGIGDVKDEVNLLTGELTQRIGEVVLDGSEDWRAELFTVGTDQLLRFYLAGFSNCKKNANSLCDKEKVMKFDFANEDYVRPSANLFWIYRKDLTTTVEDLKQQLQANPYTIQYELATESIKTVDLTVIDQDGNTLSRIKPIEGTMHIATDGTTIKPTFECEVPVEAITQNLTSFIEE